MNWGAIFAIVRKDLKVITRSKGVLLPIILVPLIVCVLLPAGFAAAPQLAGAALAVDAQQDLEQWLRQLPDGLRSQLAQYNELQTFVVLLAVYFFAPMYLILPLMVSSVIAADSIAGEKERKTLEALLYTPTSDQDLMAAKFLSAWLPAVAVAWGGFLLYAVVLNVVGWPLFGYIFFPNRMWWLLALWVAPALAGFGLGVTILISARVGTFQEAYQIGGLVVLPVVGLMISQSTGALYFGPGLVFVLGAGAWLIDLALIWLGARVLRRSALLERL
ncbi:MAG TPA: ABC transporter permease subunit [Caldilineaceae bacterium]|nr:ABC transporter permease subunit [Caldilineaceae bacterium]